MTAPGLYEVTERIALLTINRPNAANALKADARRLLVDLLRSPVLKPGVPTLRIVPEFDILHNVTARVLPGRILGPVDTLVLQRSKERFGHCIIVTYPCAPTDCRKLYFSSVLANSQDV